MKRIFLLSLAGVMGCAGATSNSSQSNRSAVTSDALIPRTVLFGNPERIQVRLSADGKHLAWQAPVNGIMNLWVAPADDMSAAKSLTNDTGRGVATFQWAYDHQHLLYLKDKDGSENYQVYAVNIASGESKSLTPFDGVRSQLVASSAKMPNQAVVSMNRRDKKVFDLFTLDLKTGKLTELQKNEGAYVGWSIDHQLRVRFASKYAPDGSIVLFKKTKGKFQPFKTIPADDTLTSYIRGFDGEGKTAYLQSSVDRENAALYAVDMQTGKETLVAEVSKGAISGWSQHPTTFALEAVQSTYLRSEWQFKDANFQTDFEKFAKAHDGDLKLVGRTLDDKVWLGVFEVSTGPYSYYLFDRAAEKATFLLDHQPALAKVPLAPMHSVEIKSRDGLILPSYYTLPNAVNDGGSAQTPVPMVLLVHGGPWERDKYGYRSFHQWLANRGYAVLSVNFRSSTGFGKSFVNAGDREWAAKMHNDLLDAVQWAVDKGITTQDQVAIMGGSYGGYATLVGLTFTPETFACGVDIVGPSNLVTLLNSIPPYWAPLREMWKRRMGDVETEEGRAFLMSRSPLTKVDAITKPLLIGQGANDPRVKQAESDQIVDAMRAKNIPVTYALFPDEGHGFARPENRLAFFAITEGFLAECLGGRSEPIGDAFDGSSLQIKEGADHVKGLKAALSAMK